MSTAEAFPVLLADGPRCRASGVRALLDAAGWPSLPLRGDVIGPAIVLVDLDRDDAPALLKLSAEQVRVVPLPEDPRALLPAIEEASLGLGLPEAEVAARTAEVASSLSRCEDLDHLLQTVANWTKELVSAEAASVLLVDPDTGELVFRVARGGTGDALTDVRLKAGEGIAGWVAQHRLPTLVSEPASDVRFSARNDQTTGFVTRSIAAVPLFWRGDAVGVLEAINHHPGAFGRHDLNAMAALAPHVSTALNHTRMALALQARVKAADRRTQDLELAVQERTRVIARAKAEWEQTFDAISEPLAILDGFVVRRANRAYALRARLPINQVPGKTCYRLLGRDGPCPGCPLARTPRSLKGEVELAGGAQAALSGFPTSDGGTVVHYRDVSAERELEAKLRQSDRLAAVGQLAAGAAHEINNPLGFVSSNLGSLEGYLSDLSLAANRLRLAGEMEKSGKPREALAVLARVRGEISLDDLEEWVRDAGEVISESRTGLKRMADIVRALKELAREELSTGGELFPLSASLDHALARVAPEFSGVKVTWLERQAGLVRGHPLQLQHAFAQVIKNAFQAVCPGTGAVQLACEELGAEARVRIVDNGCGISPDARAKVFEPFFTTRGVGGGLGLGLTAAYGIVTRHGGRIELLESSRGRTEVLVVLPLAQPELSAVSTEAVGRGLA